MPHRLSWVAVAAAGLAFAGSSASGQEINFNLTFGEGVSPQAQQASQFAVDIWGDVLLASYPGETIDVFIAFGDLEPIELATARPAITALTTNGVTSLVTDAQIQQLTASPRTSSSPDVSITFNNSFAGSFDYDTDDFDPGDGVTSRDFASIVVHEIGHGLGILSSVQNSGGFFIAPTLFDRFVTADLGSGREPIAGMTNAERLFATTSGGLFFDGPSIQGLALYAPDEFRQGSSVAHLDEDLFGDFLMSPIYTGLTYDISLEERLLLQDIGWRVVIPEPAGLAIASLGLVGLRRRRR